MTFNLIVFPDWTQPQDQLTLQLQAIIKTIASHPDQEQFTILLETSNIALEYANLLLSGAALELLMQESLEVSENTVITCIESILPQDWPKFTLQVALCLRLPNDNALQFIDFVPQCALNELQFWRIPDLNLSLAQRLFQARQWQQASEYYEPYLQDKTGTTQLYWQLAECYRWLRQPALMLKVLSQGIELYPKEGSLYFMGILDAQRRGDLDTAIDFSEKAVKALPNDYTFKIFQRLLIPAIYHRVEDIAFYQKRFAQGLEKLQQETQLYTPEKAQAALMGILRIANFYLPYQAFNVRELQTQYAQLIHNIVTANYPQFSQPLEMPARTSQGKIKVGYASAYLHSYSGTLWLTGWLKQHNREEFEVYCYYTGNKPDEVTEVFKENCDYFYHIPNDLTATATQIFQDQLHILVYPELGMDAPTFAIAALRLAPVQCTAWGHPVTTGLPTLDYFLSSELMEGENPQDHYSETLIQLPNIGVAYPKPKIPPLIHSRNDYDLPEASIIYLCCQAPIKYLPQYDDIFPAIAQQVPQAKFLFLRGELMHSRLQTAFAKVGLNYKDYCLFRKIPDRLGYLSINLLSDVYLDTFTWSGGNTSLEAIACHLPIVTCPGEFMRGRHTDSFLKMIGVTETIAQDKAEYITIAVKLGQDRAFREEIKAKLKQQCDRLYDDPECVQGLETFYRQVVMGEAPNT